jgi:glycosyltransferase involved in cell wall biosynthesis
MKNKISVVIAALNEAPRIADVLKVTTKSPLIDEVIVVNDGSTDNTSEIVKKFDVILIENENNIGKTQSVKKGIEKSKNDLIMMLDADLYGLNQKSLEILARPVLSGKVDCSLSILDNSFKIMKLLKVDWMSGIRVFKKELLNDPIIWSKPEVCYGLETLMNKSMLNSKKTFRVIRLKNVCDTNKSKKHGFIKGWGQDINMIVQISKAVPLHEFLAQFISMAYLNKKYSKQ